MKIIESKILEKSKKNSLILDADSFHERTERISIWRIEKSAKMIGNRSYRRSIGKRIGRPMTTMTTTMMIQRSTIGCTQRDRRSEREGGGGEQQVGVKRAGARWERRGRRGGTVFGICIMRGNIKRRPQLWPDDAGRAKSWPDNVATNLI